MNRRKFLKASAVSVGSLMLPSALSQAAVGPQKTVVFVFLRGGMDGLSLLSPHRKASGAQTADYLEYERLRRSMALEAPRALPGNDQFDIHPACGKMVGLWNDRDLLFVAGAGSANPTRSHFAQQDIIEQAASSGGSGFLNRALEMIPGGQKSSALPAASISNGVTKSLRGPATSMAVPSLTASLNAQGIRATFPLENRVRRFWSAVDYTHMGLVDHWLRGAGSSYLRSVPVIKEARDFATSQFCPVNGEAEATTHHYGGHHHLLLAARLLKADPAMRYLTVDIGGWDHHANMGPNQGSFFDRIRNLDHALAAFARDLDRHGMWNRVRVVVMSEFGRRVAVNGSSGTDHGRGGVAIVMGGNLNGKRVLQRGWGLKPEVLGDVSPASSTLDGGDVRVTVDYRDIFAELIKWQGLGAGTLASVFPQYTPRPLGIWSGT